MQHTYLRYECADSFGLISSSASSKAPHSNSILAFGSKSRNRPVVLTTAGSYCVGYHLRTTDATIKIGHRENLTGGVGTGRSLNSDQVVCLDVAYENDDDSNRDAGCKVATGWVDGAVRVFDVKGDELNSNRGCGLVQSLLHDSFDQEDFVMREPLVLNGHSGSPVRSMAFDSNTNGARLASGSSDGSVVLWDIVAETGLFRLLGHRGGITDIQFVSIQNGAFDLLMTSSLDGFVKVWDLKGQCCIQTIPSHRGEVWASACLTLPNSSQATTIDSDVNDDNERIRLVTGSSDGQARVWSVRPPKRYQKATGEIAGDATEMTPQEITPAIVEDEDKKENLDDVCQYMGTLMAPPNVATSAERISCIHFHPNGKYVGVLHANSKNVDVYVIRSVQESLRKKQRRLKRRKEKTKTGKGKAEDNETNSKGQKRGLLDDPESDDEHDKETSKLDKSLDPEDLKASDEFEYFGTVRASHKLKGFIFAPFKEAGGDVRIVCSLATNALETHSLARKKTR
jgi:WD40 repeat protein